MTKLFLPFANRTDGMSSIWAAGSRVALLLTAIVILVMPLTEYFWHFDQFLRGGEDFELGLLLVASIICLALVLLQHSKRLVQRLLSVPRWLSTLIGQENSVSGSCCRRWMSKVLPAVMVGGGPLGKCTFPLKV